MIYHFFKQRKYLSIVVARMPKADVAIQVSCNIFVEFFVKVIIIDFFLINFILLSGLPRPQRGLATTIERYFYSQKDLEMIAVNINSEFAV